jgi:predicted nucleotidyltransferase component of viral defense system
VDAFNSQEGGIIELSLDAFAAMTVAERRPYFEASADRRDTLAVIIEKDFWVVWTLKHLFALNPRPPLIFKGGTSLSKAFGIIERFSEDIDLIVDRGYFGFSGEHDIAAVTSTSARNRRLDRVSERVASYVASDLLPSLRARFDALLSQTARLEIDPQRPETLLFYYPTDLQHDYVRSMVQIEMGGNADNWPTVVCGIRAYVQEDFPAAIAEAPVDVVTIDAARTFWEKLTILHKTAHRLEIEPAWIPPPRYSRHYYDVYRLSRAGVLTQAFTNALLVDAVRDAAQMFFGDRKAKYEEFTIGTIRVLPDASGVIALARDYTAMRDMIFGEYPSFDEILRELADVESLINARR